MNEWSSLSLQINKYVSKNSTSFIKEWYVKLKLNNKNQFPMTFVCYLSFISRMYFNVLSEVLSTYVTE